MKLQISVEGKTYEVEVELLEEEEGARPAHHGSYPPVSAPLESTLLQGIQDQLSEHWSVLDGEKVCLSPVTGIAIKVNVVAGQSVATNDLLLVLEAMKMETRVTAPAAGRVKSVNVKAGDSVKLGQVLIEFD